MAGEIAEYEVNIDYASMFNSEEEEEAYINEIKENLRKIKDPQG